MTGYPFDQRYNNNMLLVTLTYSFDFHLSLHLIPLNIRMFFFSSSQLHSNLLWIVPGVVRLFLLLRRQDLQLATWVQTVGTIEWKIISTTKIINDGDYLKLLLLVMMIVMMIRVMLMLMTTCVRQVRSWKRGLTERGLLPLSTHPLKKNIHLYLVQASILDLFWPNSFSRIERKRFKRLKTKFLKDWMKKFFF